MLRFLSFPLVAMAIVIPFIIMVGNVAHATRPIVYPRVDLCSDIRGVQDSSNHLYTWRWKVKTAEVGDCRRIPLLFRG